MFRLLNVPLCTIYYESKLHYIKTIAKNRYNIYIIEKLINKIRGEILRQLIYLNHTLNSDKDIKKWIGLLIINQVVSKTFYNNTLGKSVINNKIPKDKCNYSGTYILN